MMYSNLPFFRVPLFSCCTFFRVALFSCRTFFRVGLFSCCTFFFCISSFVAPFSCYNFSCYASSSLDLHFRAVSCFTLFTVPFFYAAFPHTSNFFTLHSFMLHSFMLHLFPVPHFSYCTLFIIHSPRACKLQLY